MGTSSRCGVGRWLGAAAWTGATQRDLYLIDLDDLEQEPQLFVGGEGNQSQINWLNEDFVYYLEDATPSGDLVLRRFPDTGAVWTFPSHPEGYLSAVPEFGGQALLARAPDGIYRLPVDTSDGSVTMGRPSLIESRTTLDRVRFSGERVYPDGERSLVRVRQVTGDELLQPSLMYVDGWARDVARKLAESR